MAKGYKSGVSSLPAGLKIVGNPRPSFPKEGIVWVNTDVEPTGHHLSATAPGNPIPGMLWIKISDSSNVEIGTALGKDYITIMLNSVSQYVDGAWVSVEAMSFQGGVWVEWFPQGALYWCGDERTELTGGWKAIKGTNSSGYATVQKNKQSITAIYDKGSGTFYSESGIATTQKVNITGKTKICVNLTDVSATGVYVGLTSVADNFGSGTLIGYTAAKTTGESFHKIEGQSGYYYIALICAAGNSRFTADKIWLE